MARAGTDPLKPSLLALLVVVLCTSLGNIRGAAAQNEAAIPRAKAATLPPPAPPTSVPYFPNKTKITVCVSDWTPAVYCVNKTDPVDFTGFEVELFRQVMPLLGWTADMLEWKCLPWDTMIDSIYNGTCDVAPSGLSPLPDRIARGMEFAVSSLRSGYSVMVSRVIAAPGEWYFLSAMSAEVWVAMIVTGIVTGFVVWLYEIGMQSLTADTKWMSNVMWDTLGRPVQMRDYRLSSAAANLVALTWSLLVFILMAMYTANLTANLTLDQIKSDIHGLADLPGKAVASWSGYADDLKARNIAVTPFPWDNSDDEQKMVAALEAGYVRALVLPDSTLQILDATNCQTMLVGKQFDAFDQCTAFPPDSSSALINAYNDAVINLLHDGAVEALQNRFILVPQAPCKTSGVNSVSTSSVKWSEVSGLWILLGGAAGIGLLAIALYWLWKWLGPRMYRRRWFRRACGCCLPRSLLNKSYTSLVAIGHSQAVRPRQPRRAPLPGGAANDALTPQVGGLGHFKSEEEQWDDRYQGASNGYLDGSADVPALARMKAHEAAEAEADAQDAADEAAATAAYLAAPLPPRQMSMMRSDTALRRRPSANGNGSGVNGIAPPVPGEFEAAVLRQLAELRAELAAVTGGGGGGGGGGSGRKEVVRVPNGPRTHHVSFASDADPVQGDGAV